MSSIRKNKFESHYNLIVPNRSSNHSIQSKNAITRNPSYEISAASISIVSEGKAKGRILRWQFRKGGISKQDPEDKKQLTCTSAGGQFESRPGTWSCKCRGGREQSCWQGRRWLPTWPPTRTPDRTPWIWGAVSGFAPKEEGERRMIGEAGDGSPEIWSSWWGLGRKPTRQC